MLPLISTPVCAKLLNFYALNSGNIEMKRQFKNQGNLFCKCSNKIWVLHSFLSSKAAIFMKDTMNPNKPLSVSNICASHRRLSYGSLHGSKLTLPLSNLQ